MTACDKRLKRQWCGILKENALCGNFQHEPQFRYSHCEITALRFAFFAMKENVCLWFVVKIMRLPKVFSSVWNTTVRGDETENTARPGFE